MSLCLVTGASGYVGGAIVTGFRGAGWDVIPLGRNPGPGGMDFHLGGEIGLESVSGADCLIHCAYDFSPRDAASARRVNVEGTRRLFEAAHAAGIRRLLVLSSMSAYPGCRSIYGRTKLEIEALAAEFGADVIRPGLVFGRQAGGVFGQLMAAAQTAAIIPLIDHGASIQFLVHEEDLAGAGVCWATRTANWPVGPFLLAHPSPLSMKAIISCLASRAGRAPRFVSVPGGAVLVGLRTAECLGFRLKFRSDSLVGLMHPDPQPDFAPQQALGLKLRPFPEGLEG